MKTNYHEQHAGLIAECKRGSQSAYYELYKLYAKTMYNIALKIVNEEEEAADILQEAFYDAFNRLTEFRQESSFGVWLKQIVINRSINRLHKRKVVLMPLDEADAEELADEEEYDEEELHRQVQLIRDGIRLLPDGYRIVLTLHGEREYRP